MASLHYPGLLFVLFYAIMLLYSNSVLCDDKENNLLQGINSYRSSLNLLALSKNDKAECLAGEIADQLEEQPCTRTTGPNAVPGTGPQVAIDPALVRKCKIDINSTRDGVVMPVCVPDLVRTLVLTNYTHANYATYLNNSRYTGVGIGSEDDWMVVVLSTNTPGGSFVSAANCVVWAVGISHLLLSLVLFCFVVVVELM